jgi:hypothetical protein
MLEAVDVVIAQSLPAYGAFTPWQALLWLALMAGCLLAVAGAIALYEVVIATVRSIRR